MAHHANGWFGIVVSALSIGWVPALCRAEQEKPTIDRILEQWKGRQEKVAIARFELRDIIRGVFLDSDCKLREHGRRVLGFPAATSEPTLDPLAAQRTFGSDT